MPVCKFCKKPITTDHYAICKQGSVCLGCQEKVRMMLKGIVKNGGRKDEVCSSDNRNADCVEVANGRLEEEVS